jgi:hypothetical protein
MSRVAKPDPLGGVTGGPFPSFQWRWSAFRPASVATYWMLLPAMASLGAVRVPNRRSNEREGKVSFTKSKMPSTSKRNPHRLPSMTRHRFGYLRERKRENVFSVAILYQHSPSRPSVAEHPGAVEHQLTRDHQSVTHGCVFVGQHNSIWVGNAAFVGQMEIVSGRKVVYRS